MSKLLVVTGPTATGKTQFAYELAKKYGGELISADSRQVYTGMDIGTGKDLPTRLKIADLTTEAQAGAVNYHLTPYLFNTVPLWMYDVVTPDAEFSVSHYHSLVKTVIENIILRKKLPIVVGGTGLYVKSILTPLGTLQIPRNDDLRTELETLTLGQLQRTLVRLNPIVWAGMNSSDKSNTRRLIRKIEISAYRDTSSQADKPIGIDVQSFTVGLTMDLPQLFERIDQRVTQRLNAGMLTEIEQLLANGYTWNMNSMASLGYKEWKQWFIAGSSRSQSTKEAIVRKWKLDERKYAKRQLTWFRKQPDIHWFDIGKNDWKDEAMAQIAKWYTKGV
jgi:tRNA dimethylallyltransferase